MFTNIRMYSHQLLSPVFERPGELVAWMGGVQAQDYTMAKWALGLRMKQADPDSINEALRTGEIIRTHIMRPTWHFVAGKDLRWMLSLSAARVKTALNSWMKSGGIDIPEETFTRCNDLIGKMLSGGHSLTREAIEAGLVQAGMLIADDRAKRYLLRAEVEGIVCSGADYGGKPTYALLDEQVPSSSTLSREEALAQLAQRYFRSHSPATLKDFIWWSGLTVTEAKKAVQSIGSQLVTENFGQQEEFLVHESCQRQPPAGDTLCFLPPFDEYLISYKERNTVLDPCHYPKAFNRWGIFYPVILYNGRIVGNWNKTVKKEQMTVTASFFVPGIESRISPDDMKRAEDKLKQFWNAKKAKCL